MVHIHNGILLSHKEEQNWVICRDTDGLRDCHTEWSNTEREKNKCLRLMHTCGIWKKNSTDDLICKAETEIQT